MFNYWLLLFIIHKILEYIIKHIETKKHKNKVLNI